MKDTFSISFLLCMIRGVAGIVYPLLNRSFQPPVGVHPIKNVDFPLLRHDYSSLAGVPNSAKFHDPNVMGICRLGSFSSDYEALDPSTLSNPALALISIADAFAAGCPRYQYLGYANGWYQECPEGTDVARMLQQPGLLPCSTAATRPQLALWIQLGPVDPWCCHDVYFGTPTPANGYNPEEMQSIVPQTGISSEDAMYFFFANNISYINVTSDDAHEMYTKILRSKGFDFYMIFRQVVSLIYVVVEVGIIVLTARHEGFRMNLKWGVLIGIFLMTLMMTALHALFLAFRSNSYQLPTHGTPTQISLMCFGFMFGYESLSLMLLKWLTISSNRGTSTTRQKYALTTYRGFIFLSMVWFPVITCACVVAIVRAAALNSLDVLNLFYTLWNTLSGSLAISLFMHALGFLFSGYRLTASLNKGKQMQAGQKSGTKSFLATAVREAKPSVPKAKNGLTETVRNLMIAVVFGWTIMGIEVALGWGLGLGSRYGFWGSFVFFDICIAWIAAASYAAMSAGMMETVIETHAGSRNKHTQGSRDKDGPRSTLPRASTTAKGVTMDEADSEV
ncbi:uncharacterized protein EV422DRAFT_539989 [Fimicolochytrium jonesii]|uniref:uncharacterized protein n=1 Tax=Fimicolochytrium jonesii TaxID=1396493 RepID=UPI0022FE2A63|nr:uncharacterized protein EV422DRAFT_539989 [Fimicolochytrium jonesii]KAI8817806.1 hypothetical protein EV422DRAFT_539989 [Fimicolochytrium jonesii]